jgi:predicted hotdog family 3-hydroxylacyl-ACP dehydratase
MMLVNNEHITDLLPQRHPFVMIDNLMYDDERITRTSFKVQPENIFLVNGQLEAAALVENIAQTAAAGAGYKATNQQSAVKVGFIGAITNLVIEALPSEGDQLSTETRLVNKVFNVSMVEGKVSCGGKLLASCEMKIFLQKEP